jgi:hypothetical protein
MKEQFQIARAISSFDKASGWLIKETDINLTLEQLKTIFTPYPDDPLMYGSYPINYEQAIQLNRLDNAIDLDLQRFDYDLECYQANKQ